MPFIELSEIDRIELSPGVHIRTPFGQNLMLSFLEMEEGTVVPTHNHPHEQGGILLSGRMELTIGEETKTVEAGSLFIIPPNTPHRAAAVGGPITLLDCFSPVREDYARQFNKYIPTETQREE